jgi:hypothetical protein
MSDAVQQHYLPRCYLENFTKDGLLWVFDRVTGEFRKQSPNTTAKQKHFYTVLRDDDSKDFGIERWFAEKVESRFTPIIAKLRRRENLTPDELSRLALFVSVLKVRTPQAAREYKNMAGELMKRSFQIAASHPEAADNMFDDYDDDAAEKMAEFVRKGEYDIIPHQNDWLRAMLKLALANVRRFTSLKWFILHRRPTQSFVTSDAPFAVIPMREMTGKPVGVLTPGALKIVPLTEDMCLAMTEPGSKFVHGRPSSQEVREFNIEVAAQCERFVIARDEALLRRVVERAEIVGTKPVQRSKVSTFGTLVISQNFDVPPKYRRKT